MKRNFFADILIILLTFTMLFGSFASCSDLFDSDSNETNIQEFQHKENLSGSVNKGVFSVTTKFSSANSNSNLMRSAAPTSFSGANAGMVFAAALYTSTQTFADSMLVAGTYDSTDDSATFSFPTPSVTTGLTLEIFAFKSGTTEFRKADSLLSGKVENVSVALNSISVSVTLNPNMLSSEKGNINLSFSVPAEYSLEASCATIANLNSYLSGSNGSYTLEATGISAGSYLATFSLIKDSQVFYVWTESINVFPGMTTNAWIGGNISGTSREVTIQTVVTTLYVCGEAPTWYASVTASGLQLNTALPKGSLTNPFDNLQEAVDKVITTNDGSNSGLTTYTIYVDGTVSAAASKTVLNFENLDASAALSVVIKSLSSTAPATLKGNNVNVISLNGKSGLNLVLENLNIDGNHQKGLYTKQSEITLNGCQISNCNGSNGGGIDSEEATINLKNCTLTGNTATNGGAIYAKNTTLNIDGCTINNNVSQFGIGIFTADEVIITFSGECDISDDIYFVKPSDPQKPLESLQLNVNAETFALKSGAGKIPITPDGFSTGNVIVKTTDGSNLTNAFTVTTSGHKINYSGANGVLAADSSVTMSATQAQTALNAAPANSGSIDIEVNVGSADDLAKLSQAIVSNSYKFNEGISIKIDSSDDELGIADGHFDFSSSLNGTTNLKSVEIGEGITSIGENAFSNCQGLQTVTLPGTVTTIGNGAFSGCTSLTELNLPEGIKTIGTAAFSNCTNVTTISLPTTLESMGAQAFCNCPNLATMEFREPSNWYTQKSGGTKTEMKLDTKAPSDVAAYFRDTSSVYYNASWIRQAAAAAMSLDDAKNALQNATSSDNLEITFAATNESDFSILAAYIVSTSANSVKLVLTEESTITRISNSRFKNSKLSSIVIPSSVTEIYQEAFENSSKLTTVTIGSGVNYIEKWAFYDCDALENVIFKNKNGWYYYYDDVDPIAITSSNLSNSTQNATNLKSKTAHSWGLSYLYRIIPSSEAVDLLKDSNVPSNINLCVSVSDEDALKKLAAAVKSTSASEVELELTGITEIPKQTFENCSRLTSITLSEGMTKLAESSFNNCSNLTSVTLPSTLTEINSQAFEWCEKLKKIEIPSSVNYIGNYVFRYCSKLESIKFLGSTPPADIGNNLFDNCSWLEKIYVPAGSLSDYQTALSGKYDTTYVTIEGY